MVDTPPPTVSGALHIGHIFSYTQADVIVRYQRMMGKTAFYPIGWDDNGLPTERRVQNYFNISCNPNLPYDPDFKPTHIENDKSPRKEVSRKNFIEACDILMESDEKIFENVFKNIGHSYDWDLKYTTIGNYCPGTSDRIKCDIGYYCSGTGNSEQTACAAGTYSTAGSATCTTCQAGYYCPGGSDRVKCGDQQISVAGSASCSKCPEGQYANSAHTQCGNYNTTYKY